MADKVREALERLTVESGVRERGIWRASFTVKEVLARAEMANSPGNQRYVIYTVQTWYPGSRILPPQHDDGGRIELKVRSV